MYGYYYYDTSYLLFMIIAVVVSGYAHFKVQNAFNKYSNIPCTSGITGAQAANISLKHNGVKGISVQRARGYFTDFFDSRSEKICLSEKVYDKSSIASVSVAAHECGHATQYSVNYFPLKLRHAMVPVTNFGSKISMPLIFLGLLIPRFSFAINLGIIFYSFAVIFQLVTLPVEFDASRRALATIKSTNMLNEDEIVGAKKVLTAAALTYVAAAFTSLISLLRLILISQRRRR